ncbi:MAG TPA: hypothetical protein PK265_02760 [Candidatus Saccharibacteria bacterium]|nr:hypothetical protein [Candidatus Saccharibacteria bacterium]
MNRVKIVVFVPSESADEIRQVLGRTGAGQIGEYSFCSYSVIGKGRFIPSSNAHPHIGEPGKPEVVEEERIEVLCDRDKAKKVIEAMRVAHPYEEVAFDVYPLIGQEDL